MSSATFVSLFAVVGFPCIQSLLALETREDGRIATRDGELQELVALATAQLRAVLSNAVGRLQGLEATISEQENELAGLRKQQTDCINACKPCTGMYCTM